SPAAGAVRQGWPPGSSPSPGAAAAPPFPPEAAGGRDDPIRVDAGSAFERTSLSPSRPGNVPPHLAPTDPVGRRELPVLVLDFRLGQGDIAVHHRQGRMA